MRWCISSSLFLASVVLAADKPCTVRDNGKYWDLSKLIAKQDYSFELPSGRVGFLNVCRKLANETWGLDGEKDVGGRVHGDHRDFSLGKYNETLKVTDGMPVLVYENGSDCPKSKDMKGSAVVRFICDKNVYGAGSPRLVAQYPSDDDAACAYFFSWRTHYACPTNESSWSGFGSFLYILFMGFLAMGILYIIVGILYRRYALRLRGPDVLPRFGWSSVRETFDFCKDALEDLFQRRSDPFDRYGSAWSGWRTPSSGRDARGNAGYAGYRNVPSQRDEEEAILGEDSEEDDDGDEQPSNAARPGAPGPAPTGFIRPGPQAPGPAPWNDQANISRPAAQVAAAVPPSRPPVTSNPSARSSAQPAGPSPWSDQANAPQRAQPPPPESESDSGSESDTPSPPAKTSNPGSGNIRL